MQNTNYGLSSMNALVLKSVSILFLTVSDLSAQKQYTTDLNDLPGSKSVVQNSQKSGKISLKVRDSSIGYVVRKLGELSGVPVIFNSTEAAFSKRISVSLSNASVMDAFKEALKGSGLAASYANDGRTILVSPSVLKDTLPGKQSGQIKGQVIDSANGRGIKGVFVAISGASLMVVTDGNGVFALANVPAGKQLVTFKLLGYKSVSRSIEVGGSGTSSIQVTLSQSAASLNEVVTTATGIQRRVEVPSDIVKVDADKIRQRAPVRSVTDMIEAAQVPGVVVTRASGDPGAATRIRMRGAGSISQSNDPVYIVDGVWVDPTVQSPSRIDLMDQETIESIEFVRGPSASTLYGQNASNGVIVITTKKGSVGATRWNLSYSRDWGRAYGRIPLIYEGHGYNQITGERLLCSIESVLASFCVQDSVAVYDPNNKLVLREGQQQVDNYSLSFDGGTNAVKYSLAASSRNTLGVRRAAPVDLIRMRKLNLNYGRDVLKPSELSGYTLSSNLSLYPRENLDIVISAKAGSSDLTDNQYNFTRGPTDNPLSIDTINFLKDGARRDYNENRSFNHTNNTYFGSSVSWRNRFGTVTANGGIDRTTNNVTASTRSYVCILVACRDTFGLRNEMAGGTTVTSFRTNISSNRLNHASVSRFIELIPTLGFDFTNTKQDNFSIDKDSIPGGESSIGSGRVKNAFGRRHESAIAGWYLTSKIGILQKIYFDIGMRQDIGSAITSTSNSTYPKLGGAWLVSREGFWPKIDFINSFRVRGTIGYAAVQPEVSDIKGNYVTVTRFVDGKLVKSFELNNVGNSELEPERAMELELGFDLDAWDDRINIVANYAHSENKNALVVRRLPSSFGLEANLVRKENVGHVQNRALELTIGAIAVETKRLMISLDYNHTISDNRVKSLGQGMSILTRNVTTDGNRDIVAVGYPLGGVWRAPVIGYLDENNDGMISSDEIVQKDSISYVGSSNPRYSGAYGVKTTLFGKFVIDSRFSYQSNYVTDYRPTGDGSTRTDYGSQDVAAPLAVQAASRMLGASPISSFRWTSASISYVLAPRRWLFINARSMSVSFQGSNLGLWTKFIGRDPWVNTAILSGSEVMTTDQGLIPPPPRLFSLNVRMGL